MISLSFCQHQSNNLVRDSEDRVRAEIMNGAWNELSSILVFIIGYVV